MINIYCMFCIKRFIFSSRKHVSLYLADARKQKIYLYTSLRDMPIWQSMHFWSAAFDEALRREKRRNRPAKLAANE